MNPNLVTGAQRLEQDGAVEYHGVDARELLEEGHLQRGMQRGSVSGRATVTQLCAAARQWGDVPRHHADTLLAGGEAWQPGAAAAAHQHTQVHFGRDAATLPLSIHSNSTMECVQQELLR